jgi:L-asparaginase
MAQWYLSGDYQDRVGHFFGFVFCGSLTEKSKIPPEVQKINLCANMTDIKIITTGGTIDKIYFDAKSEFQVGAPQIGEVLKEANVAPGFEITSLLRKDSLDLTDADRNRIYKAVKSCPQNRVIVTHGTDTMITTALVLKKIAQKTIVLTGAMQPAKFRFTDAVFNIASAFTAVQLLPAGVYIAMNGRIFDPQTSRKNRELNRFERRDRPDK